MKEWREENTRNEMNDNDECILHYIRCIYYLNVPAGQMNTKYHLHSLATYYIGYGGANEMKYRITPKMITARGYNGA